VQYVNSKGRWYCPDANVDAPGVDRARLRESIGKNALKFFHTNLNVRRRSPN
jgi:hypothetical protein